MSSAKTLSTLLPTPTATTWAVALRYQAYDTNSDKEYRIVVHNNHTLFQWGRRTTASFGGGGQRKVIEHASPAAATSAALRQWAAKEAKGYWPTCGVLTGVQLRDDTRFWFGDDAVSEIRRLCTAAATEFRDQASSGDQLVLCQVPHELPVRREMSHLRAQVIDMLQQLSVGPCDRYARALVVAVDAPTAALVSQLCPVALPVGGRGDASDTALVAAALAGDADDGGLGSLRSDLGEALSAARAITS